MNEIKITHNIKITQFLKITHSSGFFSCCTIKLEKILEYYRKYKKLPDIIDGSEQFRDYKIDDSKDITYVYFKKENDENIPYVKDIFTTSTNKEQQFSEYNKLNFNDLKPFITKYFSPSEKVETIISFFLNKYKIDFNNTCAIRYRGNDKAIETIQPSYQEMVQKAKYIKRNNTSMRFLVQTDELEFLNYFLSIVHNSFHIEEIPKMKKQNTSMQFIGDDKDKLRDTIFYIASLHIMSKCKYIITTSGNGEMWMVLYRGNSKGVFQYLQPKEFIYNVKNESYDPNKKYFWVDNN